MTLLQKILETLRQDVVAAGLASNRVAVAHPTLSTLKKNVAPFALVYFTQLDQNDDYGTLSSRGWAMIANIDVIETGTNGNSEYFAEIYNRIRENLRRQSRDADAPYALMPNTDLALDTLEVNLEISPLDEEWAKIVTHISVNIVFQANSFTTE